MAPSANSYGTLDEVVAEARHLMGGEVTFSSSTTPTRVEVEAIMDRISGVLNMALAAKGFSIPITDTDAKEACSQFVIDHTIVRVRHAYPMLGVTREEQTMLPNVYDAAKEFADLFAEAFKNLGESVSDATSKGLAYTGLSKHEYRTDPDMTTYEQPKFRRGQFDG